MTRFEHGIVRVLRGDTVIGAAFLVKERLLVTCAHVVNAAGAKSGETLRMKTAQGTLLSGQVLSDYWRAANAEDIAFIRLDEPAEGVTPLALGSSANAKGHLFSSYGFPKPTQELSGRGEIVGEANLNQIVYLQLDSKQVTPGFSGAPVYDENTRRVVGMIAAITPPDEYQRQGTTAFAVPAETLREVCPEIQLVEVCPYLNLDAFEEKDALYFFGRKRVTQKLVENLKREPRFLALLGPSGSGKSSVMRAGLIPALKSGEVPGSQGWDYIIVRMDGEPFNLLSDAGLELEAGLQEAVARWLAEHPNKTRLVFVFDQFEQVLVAATDETRQRFIGELASLLDSALPVSVMMSMRDDFYSRFQKDATKLADWFERGLVNVPLALTKAELDAIITGPANVAGLSFEEGLADTIAADALAESQSNGDAQVTILPLLEFALTQLWEMRQENTLTHAAYREIEGVTGGLATWASNTYDALDKQERRMARLILELLVHPADEAQGTPDIRQARPILELLRENELLMSRTIDKLVSARLLTVKRDERTKQEVVEIIHDSLLVEWGSLKAWLEEDRPSLLIQQQLSEAANEWKRHHFEASYLFSGKRLNELQAWTESHEYRLSKLEEDFLKQSAAGYARQRRTQRIFWGMAVVLLAALFVIGPGTWLYREGLRMKAAGMSQLVEVQGGEMVFGTNAEERQAENGEQAQTKVPVDALWVEATEVTYEQYGLCVKAKACQEPLFTRPVDVNAMKDHPVAYVTLYQAVDYCTWVGRRVPNSYEWELAARGLNGRDWPWAGDEPPSDDKGQFLSFTRFPEDTAAVGSFMNGASPEGVLDLYGNVWEWTVSAWDPVRNALSDWGGNEAAYILQRGGSWDAALERITQVRPSQALGSDAVTGFRCVKSADEP